MIGALLRLTLPGGVKLWQAAATSLYYTKPSIQSGPPPTKTLVEEVAPGRFEVKTVTIPRTGAELLTQQQVLAMGQQQLRLMPRGPVEWAVLASQFAAAAYAPVHQVGESLAVPFRRAELPPVTGTENLPALRDLIADAVAGARVPVGSVFPPPWEPNPFMRAGVAAAAWLGSQLWGWLNPKLSYTPSPTWKWPGATTASYATPVTVHVETWVEVDCRATWTVNGDTKWHEVWNRAGSTFDETGVLGWEMQPAPVVAGVYKQVSPMDFPGCYIRFRYAGGWGEYRWIYTLPTIWGAPSDVRLTGFVSGYATKFLVNGKQADPPLIPGYVAGAGTGKFTERLPAVGEASVLPGSGVPLLPGQADPAGQPVSQPGPGAGSAAAGGAVVPAVSPPVGPQLPVVPGAVPVNPDGTLPETQPLPAPVTPPASVIPWPGAEPINPDAIAPPATLPGIAAKTGELEGKLDQIGKMLQPGKGGSDWTDLFQMVGSVLNWLGSVDPEGGYEISSPCQTGPGGPDEPVRVEWPLTIGPYGGIEKRLDALAQLLQEHKNLRQPICSGHQASGRLVSVSFQSMPGDTPSNNPIRKVLSYRDQSGRPEADHVAHWAQFAWEAGPILVDHVDGAWGRVRVWASSEVEGRRVIQHAADIAGVDLKAKGRFLVSETKNPRYGRIGVVVPVRSAESGKLMVSKRDGPSGIPAWGRDF